MGWWGVTKPDGPSSRPRTCSGSPRVDPGTEHDSDTVDWRIPLRNPGTTLRCIPVR